MTIKEVQLPKLGESITNATILRWFKKVGDLVKEDEILLEVATDKVNSEIPSPYSGVIKELCVKEEELVDVGSVLCKLEVKETADAVQKSAPKKEPAGPTESKQAVYSPSVLRTLKEYNLSVAELINIQGSGENGRVTKEDVKKFATLHQGGAKLSPYRQAVVENVTLSATQIPQASLMQRVNVTSLFSIIQANKEQFFAQENVKLTPTLLIAYALVQTVKEYEKINATFENNQIHIKKEMNLGIAANTQDGVIVPVIKKAHTMSFLEFAHAMHHIKEKVQKSKIENKDVQEGTITLTNFGMSGVMMGVPLIRYPEAVIVGIGAIHDHVFVHENEMKIGKALFISLTFDHRVFDGMYGCEFLVKLQKKLEHADAIFS
ncbi:MAG: Dihydrolipoyllysine-residue acetyltransferase component of pyruvate dehydrogenase complex [Chlamydiae bacterium]|nr:Dihydrolipoyllysine-residue acetyltransferase component of pyruvate dehydrogenase complex [Chlamydiota bacterium]